MHHGVRGWPSNTCVHLPVCTLVMRIVWSPCVEAIRLLQYTSYTQSTNEYLSSIEKTHQNYWESREGRWSPQRSLYTDRRRQWVSSHTESHKLHSLYMWQDNFTTHKKQHDEKACGRVQKAWSSENILDWCADSPPDEQRAPDDNVSYVQPTIAKS